MARPTTHRIGTPFKRKGSYWAAGYHTGVDFLTPTGTSIKAPADSRIIHAGRGGWGSAYGIHVIGECKGTDGRTYRWIAAHLSDEDTTVGKHVKVGDHIGDSGATGNVTGPHLHFEVRKSPFGYWQHVNPRVVLDVKAGPADKMDPASYYLGANGPHVTWLGERLVEHGFDDHYSVGPGPTFGEADRRNVQDFQLAQGWTGTEKGGAADGFPGRQTLEILAGEPEATPEPEEPEEPQEPAPVARILAREDWTSSENGRADRPLDADRVVGFTVHYPADGDVNYRTLSESEVAAKLRAYREHHLARGWADIGYNYAIDQSGRTWFLTGDTIGAHSGDEGNPTSIGVLFVVGDNESPTPAAIAAFRSLRASKLEKFPKATIVRGHQQVPGNSTACPGVPIMALVRAGTLASDAPIVVDPEPEPEPQPGRVTCPVCQGTGTVEVEPDPEPEPEPEPQPEPEPEPQGPAVAELRISTANVNAGFDGATYDRRIRGIVGVHNEARSSVRFIQEADDQDDATDLCNAMGPQFKYTREYTRDQRLAASIIWDNEKEELLASGGFDIGRSSHDSATWALLRHRESGVVWFAGTTILWPFPIGPNDTAYDDDIRRDTMRSFLRQARGFCTAKARELGLAHIPIIVGGDMNHPARDKPDVIGEAFDAYGFVDSDKAAKVQINGDKGTVANGDGKFDRGNRVDRFGLDERGVVCGEQETIFGYPHMDHNLVVISASLTNE